MRGFLIENFRFYAQRNYCLRRRVLIVVQNTVPVIRTPKSEHDSVYFLVYESGTCLSFLPLHEIIITSLTVAHDT